MINELSEANNKHVQTPPLYFVVGVVWDGKRSIPKRFNNLVIKVNTDEELYEISAKFESFVVYKSGQMLSPQGILESAAKFKAQRQREEDEKQLELLKEKLSKK